MAVDLGKTGVNGGTPSAIAELWSLGPRPASLVRQLQVNVHSDMTSQLDWYHLLSHSLQVATFLSCTCIVSQQYFSGMLLRLWTAE